jgi:hypothetical protein
MADEIAFFSNVPRLETQGTGDVFVFDGSESEGHSVELQWTSEPIENGSQLSDNRVIGQRTLPMTVVVSSAEEGGVIRDRHVQAWQRFVRLATADPPLLFEVTTALETLEDVAIARVGATRTPDKGNALVADLVLRQLVFSRTDVAENLADAAQDLGLGEVALGSQGLG